jgi:hypothetical protein
LEEVESSQFQRGLKLIGTTHPEEGYRIGVTTIMKGMTIPESTAVEAMGVTMKAGTNRAGSVVRVGEIIATGLNDPIGPPEEKTALGEDLALRRIGNEKFLQSQLDRPAANLQLTNDLLNIEGESDSDNVLLT